ncbi:MAG: ArsA-related P-loop ATPase [Myxococcota bacterium]
MTSEGGARDMPRILFVVGKGGVGRSTVATALGLHFASKGERVLLVEWTVTETIAPWFGKPAVAPGFTPVEVAPGLSVMNYELHAVLRSYFVEHLGLDIFYRRIIEGAAVQRLIESAPGLAELLFIGQLWWLTTLAENEAGLRFDRLIVDAPATGHAVSLLDLPAAMQTFGASGLLALEVGRIAQMMKDPKWTGAVAVALPEALVAEETGELVPRVTKDLGRPPLALFLNRSVRGLLTPALHPAWEAALPLTPASRDSLAVMHGELVARVRHEELLRAGLSTSTRDGVLSLPEQLATLGPVSPLEVVRALVPVVGAYVEAANPPPPSLPSPALGVTPTALSPGAAPGPLSGQPSQAVAPRGQPRLESAPPPPAASAPQRDRRVRLHVLLGAGGVGKTTLAAGYALALAGSGRRVGLLGIDPARRLQGALGLTLPDLEVPVPTVAGLSAALLRAEDCLRRWAGEACPDDTTRDRLLNNSFFRALADRFAGATDFLAAVRVAEWLERDPQLTDLVVDTAPGFNAIEFLRRPEHVSAFLEGSLVTWLRWMTKEGGAFGGLLRAGARRVLGAISRIGGTRLLLDMAEFVTLVEGVFTRMATRLDAAQRLLRSPDTSLLVVTAVRHDASQTVQQLVDALAALRLAPSAVIINRAVAPTLAEELSRLPRTDWPPAAVPTLTYAQGVASLQARLAREVAAPGRRVLVVPAAQGLDETARLSSLEALGRHLL